MRVDRAKNVAHCVSAESDLAIPWLLSEIVGIEIFRDDYNNVTLNVLFKKYRMRRPSMG
ncbi:MAG: hypothetical protein LUD29_01665 [Clostridia bacterium]|nr:hypothetical protein [Clostridia bacterium]